MADKKHASWMDIPNGNTEQRVYFRDEDARAALAGKASVFGGVILIAIGIEIWARGLFF